MLFTDWAFRNGKIFCRGLKLFYSTNLRKRPTSRFLFKTFLQRFAHGQYRKILPR